MVLNFKLIIFEAYFTVMTFMTIGSQIDLANTINTLQKANALHTG